MTFALIDPHVHIYPQYSITILLKSLFANFIESSKSYDDVSSFCIILTETNSCDYYHYLANLKSLDNYNISCFESHLKIDDQENPPLYVFPGRQTTSQEGIEILGLFVKEKLPENTNFYSLIDKIDTLSGLTVINWAPGKWTGARGKFLNANLSQIRKRVVLGFTPLLPNYFPLPRLIVNHMKEGGSVICGSDPLPQPGEESIAASLGIIVEVEGKDLEQEIKSSIITNKKLSYFGNRNSTTKSLYRLIRHEISRRM